MPSECCLLLVPTNMTVVECSSVMSILFGQRYVDRLVSGLLMTDISILKAMEEIHKLRSQLSYIVHANFADADSGFEPKIAPPDDLQVSCTWTQQDLPNPSHHLAQGASPAPSRRVHRQSSGTQKCHRKKHRQGSKIHILPQCTVQSDGG